MPFWVRATAFLRQKGRPLVFLSGCREYGLLEPEFSELGDSFRVNIFRKTTANQDAKKLTDIQKKLVSLIQSDAKISKHKKHSENPT